MVQLIVDMQGAQLRKDGERLNVQKEGNILQTVPLGPLHQVILMGRGVSASTPLLYDLVRRGVDVVYQSQGERFAFRLAGPLSKHSALRVNQVLVSVNPARALPLARAMVAGKLCNQAVILARYGDGSEPERRARVGSAHAQRALSVLRQQMAQAEQAENLAALRGHEGSGAAAYFGLWPALFDTARWGFHGRAYHPPRDPVNALLSLGYTLLLNDVTSALYRIGLDPAIGFFHVIEYGRPSLALDVEEEFRPVIVDTMVLHIVRQRLLEPTDFQRDGAEASVTMTDDARRFFLTLYQERLQVRVRHPASEQKLTYRQCIERQVQHLARCIQGEEQGYRPLLIR
jgi:CRISPR-associated protein Cas1